MKRALIIGAGPAGLTAAFELLKQSQDIEVIVLEESTDMGGISKTVNHNGNRMDIGGHRFFSKVLSVNDWWLNMMPLQGAPSYDDKVLGRSMPLTEGGPDPEKEDRVMLVRNRVSRIYYKHKFFDYPISMKPQTFINMGFTATMKAGVSYLGSVFHKREEHSLEDFYINRFGKVLYSMFFEGYTEKLWGRHPRDISPDWGAQRVKGLSIVAIIKDMFGKIFSRKKTNSNKVETSLIEEFSYPKLGPGQLWTVTADEIIKMGGKILKECKVTALKTNGVDRIEALTYEHNGTKTVLEGDIFISSMPLKDLLEGMSDVPSNMRAIAKGLPYRDFITVGLLVPKLNLKNKTSLKTLSNIVPDCWIYVQDIGVKLGRIQIFNNWSPYMVERPEETVWIGLEFFCSEGDEFWNMEEEQFIRLAIDEIVSMGVIGSAEDVIDSHRERVKKAYPAYFDTYAQIDDLIAYLNQFQNLYCVGRNGQHRYNNIDHSMVTSFEAVNNILSGVVSKDNVWSVNTDKQYHESNEQ